VSNCTCEECNLGCPVNKLMDGLRTQTNRANKADARLTKLVDALEMAKFEINNSKENVALNIALKWIERGLTQAKEGNDD